MESYKKKKRHTCVKLRLRWRAYTKVLHGASGETDILITIH